MVSATARLNEVRQRKPKEKIDEFEKEPSQKQQQQQKEKTNARAPDADEKSSLHSNSNSKSSSLTPSPTATDTVLRHVITRVRRLVVVAVAACLAVALAFALWMSYELFPFLEAGRVFPLLHRDPACASAGQYLRLNGWKAAEGFHVVCLSEVAGGRVAHVWKNIQVWDHHVVSLDGANTTEEFRALFDEKIIDRKPITAAAKANQEPWRLFTPTGDRLATLSEVQNVQGNVMFLYEGGHWLYHPHHIGYQQKVLLDIGNVTLTTMNIDPLVFTLDRFATPDNEVGILQQAIPKMKPSEVLLGGVDTVGSETGLWTVRTSYHTWLIEQTNTVDAIDSRIVQLTRFPRENQEHTQVVQYSTKQRLHAHHDYHVIDTWEPEVIKKGKWNEKLYNGFSNRFATVLWYMNDVEKGGQTWFASTLLHLYVHYNYQWAPPGMCSFGVMAKARRGSGLLFYLQRPNGVVNPLSLHSGCPVHEGSKHIANKWVWNKKFQWL